MENSKKRSVTLKKKKKVGTPPGTLIYTGDIYVKEVNINIIDFNKEFIEIRESKDLEPEIHIIPDGINRWVKISGLSDVALIEKLGDLYSLHPLVMEDILNPIQRPKFEEFEDFIFLVLRNLVSNQKDDTFMYEQLSFVLGANFVMSFQEQDSDLLNPIIERIIKARGKVRLMGPDYFLYTLIDLVIDNYFIIAENFGEKIEDLEDQLIHGPEPGLLKEIYGLKRTIIDLRKHIYPIREVIRSLQREQTSLIHEDLQIYLRDIYDHIFRITDLADNYRDIIFGMLEMYLSSISNKMNEIMKVLTIISTLFIPLSFLVGFYGMNFKYMPEFESVIAYPILIGVMISIVIILILFFRKKKWI